MLAPVRRTPAPFPRAAAAARPSPPPRLSRARRAPQIGLLDELNEIDLHENRLTGSLPDTLGQVGSNTLSKIQMQDNFLTGAIPDSIGELGSLRHLDLCAAPAPARSHTHTPPHTVLRHARTAARAARACRGFFPP